MNATAENTQKRESQPGQVERTHGGRCYCPAVDIVENQDELLMIADMPGAAADSINIDYENGQLHVQAAVPTRGMPGSAILREYGVGDFHRTFQVGEGIDAQRIEAEYADGLLTVHLPKSERVKTRRIAVKNA